ncbi:hypothetical protein VCRA2110O318_30106 [Vibrio crassostreae]|nr:hypothetical protein VCRA2117O328_30195 [Vibrio crassostreae]CAK2329037.1 hypothetical protein VCRA2110O318_30106 [Vibrio crassostreae]CAK2495749.1 hypothetical protein VCRA2110O319_40107 [Vibrio crassostreae]CAK2957953.1 hypothetical protein VCRA217O317_50141 [Vibrio crassostreae]
MERICGAHGHTVCVFTLNTIIAYDKCHDALLYKLVKIEEWG